LNKNEYIYIEKKYIQFLILAVLAMLGRIINIPLIFSVSLSLSSVFLFIILKIYGFKLAVLASLFVNGAVFFWVNQDIVLILSFLEMCFIGFVGNKRRNQMAFLDAVYWIFFGGCINCLAMYIYQGKVGIEVLSIILIYLLNGIFNITLADILTTYEPFRKLFGFHNVIKKQPTILVFLVDFSIVGILGPFLLFLIFSSLNFDKEVKNKTFENSKATEDYINSQISKWSSADIRSLKLKSLVQIRRLENLIKGEALSSNVSIQVLNNDKVYASNISTDKNSLLDRMEKGKSEKIFENFYIWKPLKKYYIDISRSWYDSIYIYKSSIYDFKLIIKTPVNQYSTELLNSFIQQALIILTFSALIAFLILFIKKFIVGSLSMLLDTSTGLPKKLKTNQSILWPHSGIFELSILTNNFKSMSEELRNMIMEYKGMYENLEKKTIQLIDSEKKLHDMAYYDALTGLPNRHYFTNNLESMSDWDETNQPLVNVIMIDLDRFKKVNDTLGHLAGDLLLKTVAERLNGILNNYHSNKHLISRLGGDEFIIIINDLNEKDIIVLAKSIIEELKKPIKLQIQDVIIGSSIGISTYPCDGKSMVEIVKNADMAMYSSKEVGGNNYCLYKRIKGIGNNPKMILEDDMNKAFEQKEFVVFYQPIVDANTFEVTGAEALIRWNHPIEGLINTDRFKSLAEETGLIIPIGEWVLREACFKAKSWQDKGMKKIKVSVNCSILQFQHQDMFALVKDVLYESGLEARFLELEVTEILMLKNVESFLDQFKNLVNMGVSISIDDFGNGNSSFAILKDIPVCAIKIDNYFIKNLHASPHNFAICKAAIQLAHDINLKVTAEGIETIEERNCLKEMGCDEMQGYYFSEPISSDEFEKFMNSVDNQDF